MRRIAGPPRRCLSTQPAPRERIRCFALPLLPNKWAFYPDIHHAHTNDLFGSATHSFKGRAGKLFDRARSEWEECVHAPPGTIRHRIFQLSLKLQARIDPREILCRALIPHGHDSATPNVLPSTEVTLIYPAGISQEEVQQAFLSLLLQRVSRHTILKYGSIAMLPVSLAAGVLPGPNIFFAWNLVRLWAHYRAEKGARAALAASSQLELQSSDEMRSLVSNGEGPLPVSDEALNRIEQRFDLPALTTYMQRTRERLLKEK